MNTRIMITILVFLIGIFPNMNAQEHSNLESPAQNSKKAWEIGLGGTVFQFSRIRISNFTAIDNSYQFDLALNHAVWGSGIYAARELNRFFYLNFQGDFGFTNHSIDNKHKFMAMIGTGIQWRFGEYFHSRYVDPYLHAGVNYMYKNFQVLYKGSEGLSPDEMSWILSNFGNKEGRDKKHLVPISLGGGVNFWLNDHLGIGLQADYLLMPYKNIANSLQGSARIIWRFGGKSKKSAPVVQYIDRPVEKIVEKEITKTVYVDKKPDKNSSGIMDLNALFGQIYFDFDSYEISEESAKILDQIANIFKADTKRRYLITGQTDSRGTVTYNQILSEARARAVVQELKRRGVPSEMMKWRGVGKKISIALPESPNQVRRGDRKTVVELVTNPEYWDCIQNPSEED